MTPELYLLYLAAAVGLTLTPGPNGLLCLTHGATFGLRPTLATVAGGALGFLVLIAASLAGLGALLAASEAAFTAAKWAGGAYLAYLGIRLWRAPAPSLPAGRPGGVRPRPWAMFRQGFGVAASNPKALVFFTAFLPHFMAPGLPFAAQFLLLGGTFVAVEVAYELALAGLAGRAAPWLARHGRTFNRAVGGAFVGLGAALAGTSR